MDVLCSGNEARVSVLSGSFVSVVLAGSNFVGDSPGPLEEIASLLDALVDDYELIVVDNASSDGTLSQIRKRLDSGALRNTVVFSLAQRTEIDAAMWIGVDSAIGDFVLTIPAGEEGVASLPLLLEQAEAGAEVAIAVNQAPVEATLSFRLAKRIAGGFLRRGASSLSRCMVISRRLVSFLQSHSQPQMTFRQLAQVPGLRPVYFHYRSEPISVEKKTLGDRYGSGIQYIFWRNPRFLRQASLLALLGAALNVIYALYVLGVFIFSDSVEAGWASLSLQFSGMFFLFSLVLFVLSENVLLSISIAGRDPVAFVSGEFTSRQMGSRDAINVRSTGMAPEIPTGERSVSR